MTFDYKKAISSHSTIITDPDINFTFKNLKNFEGGAMTIETSVRRGSNGEPLPPTKGTTDFEPISITCGENEFWNWVNQKGGYEILRLKNDINIVRTFSNGETSSKINYTGCKLMTTGAPSIDSSTDEETVVTFQLKPTHVSPGNLRQDNLLENTIENAQNFINAAQSAVNIADLF